MSDSLHITERRGLALATIMARRSTTAAEIGNALGMTLPAGPHATRHGPLTLLGTGPSSWLAISEDSAGDWFDRLRREIGPIASLSDQSSGYVVWRLSGAFARTLLQRGASVDFHPGVFKPGSVATTMIAHIGVIIWQIDDGPTYDIALFRSFAGSFLHWLDASAAAV